MSDFAYSAYSHSSSGIGGGGVGGNVFGDWSHQRNVSNSNSNSGQSPSVRRSQQIHDYVTKQKEMKHNAEQIRKDRQRADEHKRAQKIPTNGIAMAATPTSSAASTDRSRHSTYEEDINFASPNNTYETRMPTDSNTRDMRSTQSAAVNGRSMHKSSSQSYVPINSNANTGAPASGQASRSSSSHPHSAGHRHPNASPAVPLPSQAFSNRAQRSDSSSSASAGGCSCVCTEHGDMAQKVAILEDQIRLLRHQNKIFLSFMQATEQQLNALRAQHTADAPPSSSAAASNSNSSNTRPSSSALLPGNTKNQKAASTFQGERLTDRRREEMKRVDDDHDDERGRAQSDDYPNSTNKAAVSSGRHPTQLSRQQTTNSSQQANTQPRSAAVSAQRANPSSASHPSRGGFQSSALQAEQEDDADEEAEYGDEDGGDGDGDGEFDIPENAEVELFSCPDCGRRFHQTALQRHISKRLCKPKQRKVFDIQKRRIDSSQLQGVKMSSQANSASASANDKSTRPTAKIPKWKLEHMRFQDALKEGKRLSKALKDGVDIRTLPPPKASYAQYPNAAGINGSLPDHQADDRTPCPHCGRKFDEEVAKRHIPKCKDIINKPRGPMSGSSAGQLRQGSNTTNTKPPRR